jgi:hypothetical protein
MGNLNEMIWLMAIYVSSARLMEMHRSVPLHE